MFLAKIDFTQLSYLADVKTQGLERNIYVDIDKINKTYFINANEKEELYNIINYPLKATLRHDYYGWIVLEVTNFRAAIKELIRIVFKNSFNQR